MTTDPGEGSERAAPSRSEQPFRERALGGGANPLEHIDHLFHQTSKRIWLGVLGLAMLLAAGVLWTAVADQAVTAEGPAVIVPHLGIFTAGELESGVVRSVLVEPGTRVTRGQALAEVELPEPGGESVVQSPIPGRIMSVEVRAGDTAQVGTTMFRIVPLNTRAEAIALFPAASISQIAVGQDVSITVNGVAPDLFGRAAGRVLSIGEIPVSDQRLHQLTGDFSLVELVTTLGPLREVEIELTPARTPSKVAWNGGNGPAEPLPIGVRAVASVTIGRETYIEKVVG